MNQYYRGDAGQWIESNGTESRDVWKIGSKYYLFRTSYSEQQRQDLTAVPLQDLPTGVLQAFGLPLAVRPYFGFWLLGAVYAAVLTGGLCIGLLNTLW